MCKCYERRVEVKSYHAILLVCIVLFGVGCSGVRKVWYQDGVSAQDTRKDLKQCEYETNKAAIYYRGRGLIGRLVINERIRSIINLCMEAKGYAWAVAPEAADQDTEENARKEFRKSVDATDKELETEGYPGFKLLVPLTSKKFIELLEKDPEATKKLQNTEVWKQVYKEQVYPSVRALFVQDKEVTQ